MASHMEEKRKARCAGGYGASAASPRASFFCSPAASSLNSSHMEEMCKARCAGGYGASAASPRASFFSCSPPASSLNSVF